MAGFNIVAQLQLSGPTNLRPVVDAVRNAFKGISVDVDVRLARGSTANISALNAQLVTLSSNLKSVVADATNAANAVRSLASAFSGVNTVTTNLNNNVNNAAKAARSAASGMQEAGSASEEFGRQAGLATKRFLAFSLAAGTIVGLITAIKNATSEAIDFQHQLIKIEQSSNDTKTEIQAVSSEITKLATTLGVSSKELVGVAFALKQAGYSADDVKTSLEAIAKSSLAPSFDNMKTTTEGVIAIFSQFKIQANELEGALGSINAVSNAFAVESKDIIDAIRRSGAAFQATGGNLNEFIALFTSVRATTRESAESIATGLRTIFTRIQRNQTVEALKDVGVQLRFTKAEAERAGDLGLTNQFVGGYEAVRRLSIALKDLRSTDPRFAQIAEQLGGYRQIEKVIPLLQEFKRTQEALLVAQQGTSSVADAAAKAQEALAVKIAKVREEFLALLRVISESKAFNAMVDTALAFSSAIISITKAITPLLPLLTLYATAKLAIGSVGFIAGATGALSGAAKPTRFARGGLVPGVGDTDSVPAMLQPGEYVLRKSAVQAIGADRLHGVNKYASGGVVQTNANPGDVGLFYLQDKGPKGQLNVLVSKSGFRENTDVSKDIARGYTKAEVKSFSDNTRRDLSEYSPAQLTRYGKRLGITGLSGGDLKDAITKNLYDKNFGKYTSALAKTDFDSISVPVDLYPVSGFYRDKVEDTMDTEIKGALDRTANQVLASSKLPGREVGKAKLDSVYDTVLKQQGKGRFFEAVVQALRETTDKKGSQGAIFDVPRPQESIMQEIFGAKAEMDADVKIANSQEALHSVADKTIRKFGFKFTDKKDAFSTRSVQDLQQEQAGLLGEGRRALYQVKKYATGGPVKYEPEEFFLGPQKVPLSTSQIEAFYSGKFLPEDIAEKSARNIRGARTKKIREKAEFQKGKVDSELHIPLDNNRLGIITLGTVGEAGPTVLSRAPGGLDLNANAASYLIDNGITRVSALVDKYVVSKKMEGEFQTDISNRIQSGIQSAFKSKFPQSTHDFTLHSDQVAGIAGYLFEQYISGISNVPARGGKSRFDFVGPELANSSELGKLVYPRPIRSNLTEAKLSAGDDVQYTVLAKYLNSKFANYVSEKKAAGGAITDTVPAMLTPGEFVINKNAASSIGLSNLNMMNNVRGYASGGPVQKFAFGGPAERPIMQVLREGFNEARNAAIVAGASSTPGGAADLAGGRAVNKLYEKLRQELEAQIRAVHKTVDVDTASALAAQQAYDLRKANAKVLASGSGFKGDLNILGEPGLARQISRNKLGETFESIKTKAAGGFGIATLIGTQYGAEALQHAGGTAEDAALSEDNASRFKRFSAIGGAFSGIGQGAALGGAIGSAVPVVGTAIGALVGAIVVGTLSIRSSLNDSSEKIRQIHFEKDIKDTAEGFKKALETPGTALLGMTDKLELSASRLRNEIEKNILIKNPALKDNSLELDKQVRSELGKAIGRESAEINNRSISALVQKAFGGTSTTKIDKAAFDTGIQNIFKQVFVSHGTLSAAGGLDVDAEKAKVKAEADKFLYDKSVKEREAEIARATYNFQALAKAVEAATYQMDILSKQADLSASLFEGKADVFTSRNFSAEAGQAGIAGGRFIPAIRELSGLLPGAQGAEYLNKALGADALRRALPDIIESAAKREKAGTGAGFSEDIKTGITAQAEKLNLGGNITDSIYRIIGLSNIGSTDKLKDKIEEGMGSLINFLLGDLDKETKELTDALAKGTDGFTGQYSKLLSREITLRTNILEESNRVAVANLNIARGRAGRFAEAIGRPSDNLLSLEALQAPLKANQQALGGAIGENPAALAFAISQLRNERVGIQQRLGTAPAAEQKGLLDRSNEVELGLRKLGKALDNLTDSAARNKDVQDKLNDIQRNRDARLSLTERLVRGTDEERAHLNQGAGLAIQAGVSGLRGFNRDNLKTLFDFLDATGSAKISGLGGITGGDFKKLILGQLAGAGGIDISPAEKGEAERLRDVLEANNIIAAQAEQSRLDLMISEHDRFIQAVDKIEATFNAIIQNSGGLLNPVTKAAGGSIFKPRGTDTVPAMLTPGEYVVNKDAAQANRSLLEKINRMGGSPLYRQDGGETFQEWRLRKELERTTATADDNTGDSLAGFREEKAQAQEAIAQQASVGAESDLTDKQLAQTDSSAFFLRKRLAREAGVVDTPEAGFRPTGGPDSRVFAVPGLSAPLPTYTRGRRGPTSLADVFGRANPATTPVGGTGLSLEDALAGRFGLTPFGQQERLQQQFLGGLQQVISPQQSGQRFGGIGVPQIAPVNVSNVTGQPPVNVTAGPLIAPQRESTYAGLVKKYLPSKPTTFADYAPFAGGILGALTGAGRTGGSPFVGPPEYKEPDLPGGFRPFEPTKTIVNVPEYQPSWRSGRSALGDALTLGGFGGSLGAFEKPKRKVGLVASAVGSVPDRNPHEDVVGELYRKLGKKLSGFATGGIVPGTGSGDSVLAGLTPGEFVLNRNAVSAIGAGKLQKFNKGGPVGYYQAGGAVGDATSPADFKEFTNSVNTMFASFGNFANSVTQFVNAVGGIPKTISLEAKHEVSVIINGLEVMSQLEPSIQKLVTSQTNDAINNLIQSKFPEVGRV
jgi:hypothetical protein